MTNFGCRLAKHRGAETLEIKDLQLHLGKEILSLFFVFQYSVRILIPERNHNIRIPGFASDEPRISMSQTAIAPAAQTTATNKKGTQTSQTSVRSHRLAQVVQAKREAKLM